MSTSTTTCRTFQLIKTILILCLLAASSQAEYLNNNNANTNTLLVNQILSYVNESVAVCNDYYKHACGRWGKRHENDDYLEITGLIDQKVNENLVTLMTELQHAQRQNHLNSLESKVLRFYQTCRQAAATTRLSKHYLELVPPNEHIPWPQFKRRSEDWGKNKFNWMETLAKLHRYGMTNVIFKLDVRPDLYNSSKYTIHIDRPYFEEKTQHLRSFMLSKLTLRMLGFSVRKAWSLAQKVKQLEAELRVLAETEYEPQADDPYEELTLQQLENQIGGQWRKYLQILLGRNVPTNMVLQVENAAFLREMHQIVARWDAEVVASYIMLRFVSHLQEETMDGDESIACIQDVRRNMELATNLLYQQRFIGPAKLQQHHADVMELFELLRKQFLKKLDSNHLHLGRGQLAMLRAKMLNMAINIGNMPSKTNRTDFVNRYYANLHLVEDDDYAVNHLRLLEFRTSRWFEQLDRPLNASNYFYISDSNTGMSSTPYYMLRQNTIIVPYGILQSPIFQHDAHDIFKISLLGFMLSHELMHGFVSGGLYFDANGNYDERGAQIITDSQYTAGINCLNQNETDYLDEREADIAGIRLAYDVYFDPDSKFSQLQPDFTHLSLKQLFFLNLAQFFCGNVAPMEFVEHDADEMRLKLVLINFSAFAEAHNCTKDQDNMHPAQKCRLW